jgi:CDP-diacylglycerol--glycerol-3-phosphate 3-phosphatidyltransferase
VILFVLRDLVVDGSRNLAAKNNLEISASIWGKLKTLLQSVAIPILFFVTPILTPEIRTFKISYIFSNWQLDVLNIPILIALVFSIIGGFFYLKNIVPLLKNKKL